MINNQNILMAWSIGWQEILLILAIAVILFGRRLPSIAKDLGKSFREFKKGLKETKEDIEEDHKDSSPPLG